MKIIGIRREDKNEWEKRAPLTPAHVKELKEKYGIRVIVQPSAIRVFPDEDYCRAGAEISEDLEPASVVFAVKEIPEQLLRQDRTYVFFSHTIKGQSYNLKMLDKLMRLKTNLIDYEKIQNQKNQRLLFFGEYAGLAGMIETLHAFGQKLKLQGFETPFEHIRQAYQYSSLEQAKAEIRRVGEEIAGRGLPLDLSPMVIGFAGYGNVSRGAQEIFDLLPHKVISAQTLLEMFESFGQDNQNIFKVVFKEEDMVRPLEGEFALQDYFQHPERYESRFSDYLPYLQVLTNCIFWTDRYPRLVTKSWLKDSTVLSSNLNLRVIGDISCDIDGSIEITHQATKPDNPCFTYFPEKDDFEDGVQRRGVTVMAVDNLPCEFPRESSEYFSSVLKAFVNEIVSADYHQDFSRLKLPDEIKKGLILHRGNFTPGFEYMKEFLGRRTT
jgi:saccharopine dehydrogenase (NAD+, L-lysine-forming)